MILLGEFVRHNELIKSQNSLLLLIFADPFTSARTIWQYCRIPFCRNNHLITASGGS